MKNTNKSRTKNFARENIDLFIQKKSEADNRLIDCKDVNKMGDLKENKTKVNKEIKETKINFNLYKLNEGRNKRSKTIQSIHGTKKEEIVGSGAKFSKFINNLIRKLYNKS